MWRFKLPAEGNSAIGSAVFCLIGMSCLAISLAAQGATPAQATASGTPPDPSALAPQGVVAEDASSVDADSKAPLAAVPAAGSSSSADAGETVLSRGTVTAKKSSSTLEKAASSSDAIGGEQLEQNGTPDVNTAIQSIAGVSLKNEGVGQTEIEMRGMTSSGGSSPTTGFYMDDIPLAPPAGAQNGKVVISPSLYDMQGIEVLRGPQGTSYGSGSMGGAVKLITTPPDVTSFAASLQSILSATEGGGFNHADNLMLNIPLNDNSMALRMVFTEAYTSGWIDRIVVGPYPATTNGGATRGEVQDAPVQSTVANSNSSQQYNLRTSLLWKVTPQLTITPALSYFTNQQAGISAFDSTPGTLTHYQPFNIPEPLTDRITIASLTARYQFDHADLTWISSYWDRRSTQVEDGSEDFNNPDTGATLASNKNPAGPQPGYYGSTGTGAVVGSENDPSRQFTQEVRLSSTSDGPLQWVVGAFASNFSATWNFSGLTANPSVYMDLGTTRAATTNQWFVAHSPTQSTQLALFGNATYALDDHWKVEAGARLLRYNYDFSSTITGWGSGLGAANPSASGLISEEEVRVLPKLGISYQFDPDLMLYADTAKGFRPGGGNAYYPTTGVFWAPAYAPFHFCCGWPASYKPDDVLSYEVGEKARFFDRRLTVDASVYYEDWQHPQLLAYPGDWAFNINGNKAEIAGADLSVKAVLGGGFTLGASVGYTHDDVQPGPHWEIRPSNVMPDVPLFNGNVSLTYRKEMAGGKVFTAELDNGYVGARYSLDFLQPYQSTGEYVKLASYDLTNLRLGMEFRSGWNASLFVTNLFDKHASLENLFQETEPSAAFSRVLTNQPLTIGLNLRYEM